MIQVDISNVWGALSLGDLLNAEREVFAAHQRLTEDTVNLGWLDPASGEETGRILEAAEKIRAESDVCVVLGISISCTGARGAIELLQGRNHNIGKGKDDPQIFFAGSSFSTRQWNELCRLMEGRDVSLIVISKSGESLEPAIAFRNLRWMLERKYGTDGANSRIYAITDATQGSLRQMAAEAGWERFTIPGNVTGPCSLLSPAGLLPMAVAGIDVEALLRGACEARQEFDLRSFENPVWLYAAVRNLMYRGGKAIELLEFFEPSFHAMGHWWRQLFSSFGGKGLFPAVCELTADLPSLDQLIREGQSNLLETVLRFDPPETATVIGEDAKNLDGLNYIAGKQLDFVEAMAFDSIVSAHTDGGIPVLTVDCGPLNEETLGQLLYFFQLSCSLSACMLGVNPFDRSGEDASRARLLRLLGKPGQETL